MKQELVKISDIDLGERGRKVYKDIKKLAGSIQQYGLMHPVPVSLHPTGPQKYLLIAGGRRMRAHNLLNRNEIRCRIYDRVLSDLEFRSMELVENLEREDLSYVEKIQMEKDIYDIQIEIHGKKISTAPDASGVSMADIADLIGVSKSKLSEDLGLAETMGALKEVGWEDLKNRQEALKVKKNLTSTISNNIAAKEVKKELGNNDTDQFKKRLIDSYLIGDAFKLVAKFPSGSFNIVEVDPPYAIKLDEVKKKDGVGGWHYGTDGYNEVLHRDYRKFLRRIILESYRVLNDDGWLLFWFAPDPWFNVVLRIIQASGFKVRGIPCIWNKENFSGQTNQPSIHPALTYEMFFYARKGNPTLGKEGHKNVFTFPPVSSAKKIHPTERPIPLMEEILSTFGRPGNRVLSFFGGSGNTNLAAVKQDMMPVCFDLTNEYKDGYTLKVIEGF